MSAEEEEVIHQEGEDQTEGQIVTDQSSEVEEASGESTETEEVSVETLGEVDESRSNILAVSQPNIFAESDHRSGQRQDLKNSTNPLLNFGGYNNSSIVSHAEQIKMDEVSCNLGNIFTSTEKTLPISGGLAQFKNFINVEEYQGTSQIKTKQKPPEEPFNLNPQTSNIVEFKSEKIESHKMEEAVDTITPLTRGYRCKMCKQMCLTRLDLIHHNATVHQSDPRPYRCDQCGRPFSTTAYLIQHRRIHNNVRPYGCKFCNKYFTQLSHVQQHERIHTGEKPYKCRHCTRSFTQMSNLQSHQRQHMKDKQFKCSHCFMCFDQQEELDIHVQARHVNHKYAKILRCPICFKDYNSETYLNKHLRRHREKLVTTALKNVASNAPPQTVMENIATDFVAQFAMAAMASQHHYKEHQNTENQGTSFDVLDNNLLQHLGAQANPIFPGHVSSGGPSTSGSSYASDVIPNYATGQNSFYSGFNNYSTESNSIDPQFIRSNLEGSSAQFNRSENNQVYFTH